MRNINKYILTALCCLAFTVITYAGEIVSGKVIDVNGNPLAGVSVTTESYTKGAVTNSEGTFILETEALPTTLVFSSIGYKTSSIVAQEKQLEQTVTMEENEVMVNVAYGKQNKKFVAPSIYTISGEEILKSRNPNFILALQGKIPGLNIMQESGEPGYETSNTVFRGRDAYYSNTIVYYVDGIERYPFNIDPNEVESVTVLRDAAATAMYGLRGTRGVILINTKKGFVGKTKINISIDHALRAPTRLPDFVSAADYAQMYNQRLTNDGQTANFIPDYEIEQYQKSGDSAYFYPVRDMLDDYIKDFSQSTRMNINFQGGSEKMQFFTSLGYVQQDGIFKTETFDKYSYDAEPKNSRFNFRTNIDLNLNDNLNVWAHIGGFLEKNSRPYLSGDGNWDDFIKKLYSTPNNAHNDLTTDGEVIVQPNRSDFRPLQSVYGELNRTGSRATTNTRIGNNFGATHKLDGITEGLSATVQLAFDVFSNHNINRSRTYEVWSLKRDLTDINGVDSTGYVKYGGGSVNSGLTDADDKTFLYMYNMRASLNYERTFGNKHYVSAMIMGERQYQQSQLISPTRRLGLAGRIHYVFDNRYLAEINGAYEGSEQFPTDNQFGLFPSLAVGWIASNESFLENSQTVDFLKLRASIGQNGRQVFGYGTKQYLYKTFWEHKGPNSGTISQLANMDITWETSTKYNVGFEAELFNSISLAADYFYEMKKDVLYPGHINLPDMIGLNDDVLPPFNSAEVKNTGFDLVAGYSKNINDDLSIAINGNISFNKNEVVEIEEKPYGNNYKYDYRIKGQPVHTSWGYKTDGLFNSDDEANAWYDQTVVTKGTSKAGDIRYVDLNGDGRVTPKDQIPLYNPTPGVFYGINTSVIYKGIDLQILVNGVGKRDVYLNNGIGRSANQDNFTEYMKENAWSASNPTSDVYPRLTKNYNGNNEVSDYWVEDGSFIRLKNVELGYTLPKSFTKRINTEAIRIYVNGLNLLVWDKLPNKDFDPASGGTSKYPILKAYNIGLSVKF